MPEIEEECSSLSAAELPREEAGNSLMGKYEMGRLLGRGAFAKVYHARDLRTGQSVAIKAVSKLKVVKGGFIGHVKREVSIMRRLRHPHILRLFEVLATRTKIYFVMEFAKGGELFARVAKGRFSEDLSRRYFHQLVSAVSYCHSRGVSHRDLKPENLLLDENWNLKVSDFGLSAVRDQIRSDGMLHTLCGTPAYVAPEILAKNGYDGAKVDIWSCGIILFVLNAGYLPFNDRNLMVMYRKIYKGEFRCPKWTSPELQHFLSRLLDTNPTTRITIDEILHHPWFRRGYDEAKFRHRDLDFELDLLKGSAGDGEAKCLNAFDIISFSSGLDLSGLLGDGLDSMVEADRFVSAERPEVILERIKEATAEAGVRVTMVKGWEAWLEGQSGNFVAGMRIDRLTEELVVVEVKRRETESEPGQGFWKDKLRPKLLELIYRPGPPVPGD